MKNISGIEFKRDPTGKAKSVTIDLQKHGEALQLFLENVGASIPEDDDFEKKWDEGISGEELVKRVHAHLRTLPWEKE
jgi:hypothetical protein